MKHRIIPVFIPHLGCPHQCSFCNQTRITDSVVPNPSHIREEIELGVSRFKEKDDIEVAFYGGSFTGIERSRLIAYLKIAKEYLDNGDICHIRCSTRPDMIDDKILDILEFYGMETVELGCQSMDDEVLNKNLRGHTEEDIIKAFELLRKRGFKIGLQMMTGLIGASPESDIETAEKFVALKPDFVRIYPTLVIKDTPMADLYMAGKYQPQSLEEAVDLSANLLDIFERAGIEVIRLGLQPTEDIQLGKDVLAGPFHPSIREITESIRKRKKLDQYLSDRSLEGRWLKVYSKASELHSYVGQNGMNKKYILEKYGLRKISFYKSYDFYLEIGD